MLLSVGDNLGHYEVRGSLGAGGMGEVYRVRDCKLDRDVALKVLPECFANHPDRLARFQREARVLASLNHPNIAAIYGLEESNGVRALVMELVEGPTLAERIAQGPLPAAEAVELARQLAGALDYAHEKGIVHRDLKPANIKLTADGQVKVLDFGLAKALAAEPVSSHPASSPTLTMQPGTQDGLILGTAAYMAPEQARGSVVDKRADVWAFGVVLYEMLTGQSLFERESISDTLAAVLTKEPDWSKLPGETPVGIRRLLTRCLEKDRKRRLRDIGDAFVEEDEPQRPEARSIPVWPWIPTAGTLSVIVLVLALVHFREQPPDAPPLTKLGVSLPEKIIVSSVAISPDGRRLALALHDATGKLSLWVRPLDSLSLQPLAGTENARYPFWSPDSRRIGFFADNKLMKIDLAGGPPQIVCESGPGRGGAWTPDGVILFAHSGSGILRVPATGGEPQEVTQLDRSQKEIRHYWPWLLPGGRRLLFTVLGGNAGAEGIWIASLDNPKARRRLVGGRSNAMYAAGRLLYFRNSALMAQRLDAERGELEQDPVTIVETVGFVGGLGYGFASVSDNGSLAYLTSSPSSGFGSSIGVRGRLTWLDRSGQSVGLVGEKAVYYQAVLSPDETRIATDTQSLQLNNSAISILDPARGTTTQITFSPAVDSNPAWSPDGTRIAYSSNAAGTFDLYQKWSNGAGREQALLQSDLPKLCEDWSPDGRYLLYNQIDPKTQSDLWVLPLVPPAGTERKPFPFLQTRFVEGQGRFSPDGRWVAYVSDEASRLQVFVQSFPPGTGKWPISTNGGSAPRWRRDGRELYYLAPDGKLMAVEVKTGAAFQAGVPHALFDAHGAKTFDAAADGRKFLLPIPDESASNEPIQVVLNWAAALKK